MAAVVFAGVLSSALSLGTDPAPWRRCRDEKGNTLSTLSNPTEPEHRPVVFGNGTTKAAPTAKRSSGCGAKASFTPGQTTSSTLKVKDSAFEGGEVERRFRVYVPKGYSQGQSHPVLFHFHGFCGSDTSQGGISKIGEEHGAITVWLRGMGDGSCNSWNNLNAGAKGDESCTNQAQDECYSSCQRLGECGKCNCYTCADDGAFVRGVLDTLSSGLCLDLGRVYAAGYSNGGGAAYLLPQLVPDTFAAVLSILGQPFLGAFPVDSTIKGTALLHLGGTRDRIMPIDGSTSTCGFVYVSQAQATRAYANLNNCGDATSSYSTPHDNSVTCRSYNNCEGAPVVSCTANTGHGYPNYSFQLIWWFLLQHSRP
eukprot:Hpha_TRINITY_DN15271_c4_g1::TRINITY_DN15271_c4_g1_i1::g.67336::m.67336/K03932/lpqC; polyhydroxybutyrate depolymerase